jgi:RNA polymerase sigma-70 factor (ECF subfamily)
MGLPSDVLVRDTDAIDEDAGVKPVEPSGGQGGGSALRFRVAVLQHHRAVYRVCVGILGDEAEAEDITQETFLRYWQLSGQVRGVKAWLITVARNRCLDRLRSTRRFVDADPEIFEQQTDSRDPEWHTQRDQSATRLETLVNQLPEPQRSLVLMFDVEGMTGNECAEALNLNPNQVKVYLHRARRRLRRALEEYHE